MTQPDTQMNISAAEDIFRAMKKDFKASGVIVEAKNLDGTQLIRPFVVNGECTDEFFATSIKALRDQLSNLKLMHESLIRGIEKVEKP